VAEVELWVEPERAAPAVVPGIESAAPVRHGPARAAPARGGPDARRVAEPTALSTGPDGIAGVTTGRMAMRGGSTSPDGIAAVTTGRMAMRGGERRPASGVDDPGPRRFDARADAAPDPGPPARDPLVLPPVGRISPRVRSELRPDHGRHRIDDGKIAATVGRDGRVALRDKSQWSVPLPTRKGVVDLFRSWLRDPEGHAKGRLMPEIAGSDFQAVRIVEGGLPDVTDQVMRAFGEDPYSARKLDLLDRTRDERAGIAASNRRDDLRDSIPMLRRQLAAIWGDRRIAAAERRRLLFELWDECAETGDEQTIAAARTARAAIVVFIRRNLPAGTDAAYTASELRALDATRTSTARFDPYAAAEP
jgi:hypothetical protein